MLQFDSFLDFFKFLQDTYCIKIDRGIYGSHFDYTVRATFVRQQNDDGDGLQSAKSGILVAGQNVAIFGGSLENVTFVVTRTLASFLH